MKSRRDDDRRDRDDRSIDSRIGVRGDRGVDKGKRPAWDDRLVLILEATQILDQLVGLKATYSIINNSL